MLLRLPDVVHVPTLVRFTGRVDQQTVLGLLFAHGIVAEHRLGQLPVAVRADPLASKQHADRHSYLLRRDVPEVSHFGIHEAVENHEAESAITSYEPLLAVAQSPVRACSRLTTMESPFSPFRDPMTLFEVDWAEACLFQSSRVGRAPALLQVHAPRVGPLLPVRSGALRSSGRTWGSLRTVQSRVARPAVSEVT